MILNLFRLKRVPSKGNRNMWLAIVVALLVFFMSMAVVMHWQEQHWQLPPGPKGVPLFGNLLTLMAASWKGVSALETFTKWALEYGPLSYMRFGTKRVVVVADAQLAHQMCVKMADNFSCRPASLFVARVLRGKGVVFNDGPSWKAHRVFIQSEFRKFGFSRQSIETPIAQVTQELIQQLKVQASHPPRLTTKYNSYRHVRLWNLESRRSGTRPSYALCYGNVQYHLECHQRHSVQVGRSFSRRFGWQSRNQSECDGDIRSPQLRHSFDVNQNEVVFLYSVCHPTKISLG